jgi:hypothetical protein
MTHYPEDDHETYTHELLSLDVWGNEEDGFELNQTFSTGELISFRDDFDDEKLIEVVREALELDPDYFTVSNVAIDGDNEFGLYFTDKNTGKPLVHTRIHQE